MSEIGEIRKTYTARWLPRYEVEVAHSELGKYQVIKGDDQYVVEQKARATMAQWDRTWERKLAAEQKRAERERLAEEKQAERERLAEEVEDKLSLAHERTREAKEARAALDGILAHALETDDSVSWDSLKDLSDYSAPKPETPAFPPKPEPFQKPRKPELSDAAYKPRLRVLDLLSKSRRIAKGQAARARFALDLRRWEQETAEAIANYNSGVRQHNEGIRQLVAQYRRDIAKWQEERQEYIGKRDESNVAIENRKAQYMGLDPDAISEYCDLVLSRSEYPHYFPHSHELEYNGNNKVLIVDYQLPSPESLPTLSEVTYVQSRDDFDEKHISASEVQRTYDDILYQISLRTIHELYEADKIGALASIVFNGYVKCTDKATGQAIMPCVLSVQANRDEFEHLNLRSVEPRACFKKLKGVGSSKLHSMTPIAPVLNISREDERFVAGRAIVEGVAAEDNLAAMDWEDFEHLIRELFEEEFAPQGGEVRVTRASRDGGIDAVIFDPDPIRGGKIVIQAKRYTNTVSVSAVRDLYGSLMNEGANKGILVSTADYGPDAYEFAKGKPLVLLNGGNLLHMLEKHGHRAKIDLQEAKKILSERSRDEQQGS